MSWSRLPFLKLVLPYICGVLIAYSIDSRVELSLLYLSVFFLLAFAFSLQFVRKGSFSIRPSLFAISIFSLLIIMGYARYLNEIDASSAKMDFGEKERLSLVEIKEELKGSNKYRKYFANAYYSIGPDTSTKRFKLLINLEKSSNSELAFLPGDIILLRSTIKRVPKAANPAQFDYSKYLRSKGVYHQSTSSEYKLLDSSNSILRVAVKIRRSLLLKFEKSGISSSSLTILKAILLGDKSGLEKGVKDDFAKAGAMHILAVSGLHLGIVYLIFSQFFQLFPTRRFPFVKSVLLIMILWSFALITGLSTSVQRSALMFSLLELSVVFSRKNSSLNSVAASAFILLLIDPNTLFDPAFQLSYSAVIGIILLYPPIFNLIRRENKWANKLIALMVVSFAAQLATLPFSILFFHQFPNYFLLTNLLVIPLSFLIVTLGLLSAILLLIFNWSFYMDLLLDQLIYLLEYLVHMVAELPNSTLSPIWVNEWTIVLLAAFILLLSLYIISRRSRYFTSALITALAMLLVETIISYQRLNEDQLTVYSFYNLNCISYREGNKAIVFHSDSLSTYERKIVMDHLSSNRVDLMDIEFICQRIDPKNSACLVFKVGRNTLLIDQYLEELVPSQYDIIITNPKSMDQLMEKLNESTIVLYYSFSDHLDFSNAFNLRNGAFVFNFE